MAPSEGAILGFGGEWREKNSRYRDPEIGSEDKEMKDLLPKN